MICPAAFPKTKSLRLRFPRFGGALAGGVLILLVLTATFRAQTARTAPLAAADFADGQTVELDEFPCRYRAGDAAWWALPDSDDADWKVVSNKAINENAAATLDGWRGRGWFRWHLTIDESLAGQPLAVRVYHWGASEIYADGKLIERFGEIHADAGETAYSPRGSFVVVVFPRAGRHVVAVRHSYSEAADLNGGFGARLVRANITPGVRLRLESSQGAATRAENRVRSNFFDYLFIGLLAAFAAVHLLLYAFYRAERGNLYYAFFAGGLAATIFLNRHFNLGHFSATAIYWTDVARNIAQVFAVVSLLVFLYIQFVGRVSRIFWAIIILWVVCIGLSVAQISLPFPYFLTMLGVTCADCLRIVVQSLVKRRPGAWNIAAGVALFVVGVVNNVSFEREIHFLPDWLQQYNLYLALLSVPVAVSIFLARNFARTNRDLQAQLVRAVEHEKEKARLLVVEAENERRAQELEEARQLQLSMLPKKLPALPGLDIAVYMRPATEVGGDYYDFQVSKDGTLTAAIGDATGHGLKAGTVVTAAKTLFASFADEADIAEIFRQSSAALKKINLRGLFMAMAIFKLKNNRARLGVAGMPPVLIYRNATKTIEEIAVKALPLGSVANFPYRETEFDLSPGDCLVLMSDGFPEMFNPENEMLGFGRAAEILPAVADCSAQEIVRAFVETADAWANGRPADDDVTFVVLKIENAIDA